MPSSNFLEPHRLFDPLPVKTLHGATCILNSRGVNFSKRNATPGVSPSFLQTTERSNFHLSCRTPSGGRNLGLLMLCEMFVIAAELSGE